MTFVKWQMIMVSKKSLISSIEDDMNTAKIGGTQIVYGKFYVDFCDKVK